MKATMRAWARREASGAVSRKSTRSCVCVGRFYLSVVGSVCVFFGQGEGCATSDRRRGQVARRFPPGSPPMPRTCTSQWQTLTSVSITNMATKVAVKSSRKMVIARQVSTTACKGGKEATRANEEERKRVSEWEGCISGRARQGPLFFGRAACRASGPSPPSPFYFPRHPPLPG